MLLSRQIVYKMQECINKQIAIAEANEKTNWEETFFNIQILTTALTEKHSQGKREWQEYVKDHYSPCQAAFILRGQTAGLDPLTFNELWQNALFKCDKETIYRLYRYGAFEEMTVGFGDGWILNSINTLINYLPGMFDEECQNAQKRKEHTKMTNYELYKNTHGSHNSHPIASNDVKFVNQINEKNTTLPIVARVRLDSYFDEVERAGHMRNAEIKEAVVFYCPEGKVFIKDNPDDIQELRAYFMDEELMSKREADLAIQELLWEKTIIVNVDLE